MDDFFELFGLPRSYALDVAKLDRAYRGAQGKVHLDPFAADSQAERRVAMQWAVHANEAHQTLRDPLKRARHLCEQAGVDLKIETDTRFDSSFLVMQLEWRESLADARTARDEQAIERLAGELAAQRHAFEAEALELIDRRHDMTAAADLIRRWMFIEKMSDEVSSARAAFAD
ncbi:Fe-S protein assembly co-chaperone HscB [soil metagenome]